VYTPGNNLENYVINQDTTLPEDEEENHKVTHLLHETEEWSFWCGVISSSVSAQPERVQEL
jgi:hypothetical protein